MYRVGRQNLYNYITVFTNKSVNILAPHPVVDTYRNKKYVGSFQCFFIFWRKKNRFFWAKINMTNECVSFGSPKLELWQLRRNSMTYWMFRVERPISRFIFIPGKLNFISKIWGNFFSIFFVVNKPNEPNLRLFFF